MKKNDTKNSVLAVDWFASIVDAYESTGKKWASFKHAKQAMEFYALYRETKDPRFLDDCEKYLQIAIPKQ